LGAAATLPLTTRKTIRGGYAGSALPRFLLPPLDLAVDRLAYKLGAVLIWAHHRLDAPERPL
jgi:hypothetical protein